MKLFLMLLFLMGALFPANLCQARECSSDPNYGEYDNDTNYEVENVGVGRKCPVEHWEALSMDTENRTGNSSDCPELYQRYSADHTYCKKSTCDIITNGVTEEDKRFILDVHNSLRSKLATGKENRYKQMPPAANMMQLEWDDELARVAQAHADLCILRHDTEGRQVENFQVGQNLKHYGAATKIWENSEDWYKEEVCFYSPEYIHPFHFERGSYGHFTQLTWANTWKIGCGFTAYRVSDYYEPSLYTCNYGPGGNIPGGTHYKVGEPCSQCPKNTNCSEEYPGLCKSLTENGPQRTRLPPDNFLFLCDFSEDDPEECNDVIVTGSRNLTTRTIYTGDYKTVVLEEGESVTIDLGKARNRGGVCPFVYSRYGPNNAKDALGSRIEMHFTIGRHYRDSVDLTMLNPSQYYLRAMFLNPYEIEAKFKLLVEEGAAPQYFDIQAWGFFKGDCQYSVYTDGL